MEGKRLLILGSGFSKAISQTMPTVRELAHHLKKEEDLRREPYNKLWDDPELLFSYLSLEQPWKEPAEALKDRALFVRIQKSLAKFIIDREGKALKKPIPAWVQRLIKHLHQSKTSVITFNYDTVLERIVYKLQQEKGKSEGQWPREFDLYGLPLSPIGLREAGTFGGTEVETFHLIKLHGSINWFYSGVEGFPGEQVYYWPIRLDPLHLRGLNNATSKQKSERLVKDKIPLIIPPVAEKSRFYSNQTLRSLWGDARNALASANEIFCVGYSLPQTDLTTKLLFRSAARSEKVFIVNRSAPELKERYQDAFPNAEIDDEFDGEAAVEKMVEYLTQPGFSR